MYKPHFLFEEPEDTTIIWKYLPLDKFLVMMQTKSLYFCRADKFEDPYEGTISKEALSKLRKFTDELEFTNKDEMYEQMLNLMAESRKMTLVNCWHMNNVESDAMWKLYSNIKNSIAIQTTLGKFKQALKDPLDIYIGKVKYVDFETDVVDGFNALGPYNYKRKSFAHEQELRAILWLPSAHSGFNEKEPDKIIPIQYPDHGQGVEIDIDLLIENIYVSPLSDSWFAGIVSNLLYQYEKKIQVQQSKHLSNPGYLQIQTNGNNAENIIHLPLEVLRAFIEKDSFRIQREENERNRVIDLQIDSINQHLQSIEHQITKATFSNKSKKHYGAAALIEMASHFQRSDRLSPTLITHPEGNILLTLGQFDNLMIEINTSIISDAEKKILMRDVLFLFSRTMVQPLILICTKIESSESQIDDGFKPMFVAIMQSTGKFLIAIEEQEV